MARDFGNGLDEAKAIAITPNRRKFRNLIGGDDDHDFLSIRLTQRSRFDLRLKQLQANADVELIRDRNQDGDIDLGEVVASSRATGIQKDKLKIQGLEPGSYYIRVFPKGDEETKYQMILSASPTTETSFAYRIVQLTNQEREDAGLLPLAINTQLTRAAQAYARSMAVNDFFSHTGADGSSPWDRIRAADYDYSQAAENLAIGHKTPESTIEGWMTSPGHRDNMLAYQVQEIGVGYFYLKNDPGQVDDYHHYWSMSLGTPVDAEQSEPNVPDDE